MTAVYESLAHTFAPVFDQNSKILILGTFPSVKSREQQFYYGNPQNRFWRLLAALLDETTPQSISEKKTFLLRNRIAVWDVIARCEIIGSSDNSIRGVIPNDLGRILDHAPVKAIYGNGTKACSLYRKYCQEQLGREIISLPSTSPANAAYNMQRLMDSWQVVLESL